MWWGWIGVVGVENCEGDQGVWWGCKSVVWVRDVMRVQGCRGSAGVSWGCRDVVGVQGCGRVENEKVFVKSTSGLY